MEQLTGMLLRAFQCKSVKNSNFILCNLVQSNTKYGNKTNKINNNSTEELYD